ncbi:hypothetical protein PSTT_04415, partial [Puccinia striiformis]
FTPTRRADPPEHRPRTGRAPVPARTSDRSTQQASTTNTDDGPQETSHHQQWHELNPPEWPPPEQVSLEVSTRATKPPLESSRTSLLTSRDEPPSVPRSFVPSYVRLPVLLLTNVELWNCSETRRTKKARKLTKRRLGTLRRAKRKVDELTGVIAETRRAGH